MDSRRKKQIIISGLAIALLLVIIYGFWPKPIPVDVATVTRGPMEVTVEEEGKTRVKDRYVISAPVSGLLQRIDFDSGDRVKEGMIVARIQPGSPGLLDERQLEVSNARLNATQAALAQAKESLRLADEEAAYAQKELVRVKGLHQNGAGTDQDLDQAVIANQRAQSNKTSAEFGVKIAEHELESAQAAVKWARQLKPNNEILDIRAPVNGYILNVPNQSERPIMTGEPLMEVGDLQSLEVRVDVLSPDAVQIRPGTLTRIMRWGGDSTLDGRVRVVEPAGYTKISALGVEEQRVPVIVDFTSDEKDWNRLGDGYRVVVDFIIWKGDDVLQVPTSSLFRSGKEWALFMTKNGRAQRRIVQVGHQSGLTAEILNGVKTGDNVLTHPDERIENGVRVKPRK